MEIIGKIMWLVHTLLQHTYVLNIAIQAILEASSPRDLILYSLIIFFQTNILTCSKWVHVFISEINEKYPKIIFIWN